MTSIFDPPVLHNRSHAGKYYADPPKFQLSKFDMIKKLFLVLICIRKHPLFLFYLVRARSQTTLTRF